MKTWHDERLGVMWEPDCVDEWLEIIWDIGADYDGCGDSLEGLRGLVDELVEMASKARKCLWEGRLFPTEEE